MLHPAQSRWACMTLARTRIWPRALLLSAASTAVVVVAATVAMCYIDGTVALEQLDAMVRSARAIEGSDVANVRDRRDAYSAALERWLSETGGIAVTRVDPDLAKDALIERAEASAIMGDVVAAVSDIAAFDALNDRDPRRLYTAGRALAILGKHVDAVRMFELSSAAGFDQSGCARAISVSHYALGNWDLALSFARRSAELRRDDVEQLAYQAEIELDLGLLDAARATVSRCERMRDCPRVAALRGEVLQRDGEHAAAAALLLKALHGDPSLARARRRLLISLVLTARVSEGYDHANELVLRHGTARDFFVRSKIGCELGYVESARDDAVRAVELEPDNDDYEAWLATVRGLDPRAQGNRDGVAE